MATFQVDVGDATYEVDAPDERTAWKWANASHQKKRGQIDLDAVAEQARKTHYEGLPLSQQIEAGAGKAVVDVGRAIGQATGFLDRKDIDKTKAQDRALMGTGGGLFGNVAGAVGMAIPAAFVPGANTLAGSAAIGGVMGAMQPVGTDDSFVRNAAIGGGAGALGTAAGRLIAGGTQGAKALTEPFTGAGQDRIAGRTLQRFAGGPLNVQPSPIPGVQRTLAEATLDPGIAQLERSIADPRATSAIAQRQLQNNAARVNALRGIAGSDADKAMTRGVRELMAEPLYAQASREGINPQMAEAMQPAIENLMQRPSIRSALGRVRDIFGEESVAEAQSGSLRGLQMLKQAMDDTIERAGAPASSIGRNQLRALQQTRSDLISVMGDVAPTQRAADRAFASWSRPVNAQDAAEALLRRGTTATEDALGNPTLYPEAFNRAVRDSGQMVRRATGRAGELADVMSPSQLNIIENLGADLSRKQAAQNLGRAVGSNTAQNLASQNLMRQIAGPMGLPQGFMEAQAWPTVLRPLQFALKGQEPAIQERLAQALLDPADAQRLMSLSAPVRSRLLAELLNSGSKLLPGTAAALANGLQ